MVEENESTKCPLTCTTAGTLLHIHALINDCKDGGDHTCFRFLRFLGFDRLAQALLGEHILGARKSETPSVQLRGAGTELLCLVVIGWSNSLL